MQAASRAPDYAVSEATLLEQRTGRPLQLSFLLGDPAILELPTRQPCCGISYAINHVVDRAADYATNCSVRRAIGLAVSRLDRHSAGRTAVPSATLSTIFFVLPPATLSAAPRRRPC